MHGRRISGNAVAVDGQRHKEPDDTERTGQTQLFPDKGEHEVGVGLGQEVLFLHAVAQSHADPPPTAQRQQGLGELIVCSPRVDSVQKTQNPPQLVRGEIKREADDRHHRQPDAHKVQRTRASDPQHDKGDNPHRDGRAQIRLQSNQHQDRTDDQQPRCKPGFEISQLIPLAHQDVRQIQDES